LFGVVFGKFTSQLIKGIAELGWKPEDVLPTSAASIVPRAGWSGECRGNDLVKQPEGRQ
jgi:hypothetical protein